MVMLMVMLMVMFMMMLMVMLMTMFMMMLMTMFMMVFLTTIVSMMIFSHIYFVLSKSGCKDTVRKMQLGCKSLVRQLSATQLQGTYLSSQTYTSGNHATVIGIDNYDE